MNFGLTSLLAWSPINLAPFSTLAIYAAISAAKHDQSLLSSKAFTSLALISLLTSPLITFCQGMPSFLQALTCFNRIEEYCSKRCTIQCSAIESHQAFESSSVELQEYHTPQEGGALISFKDTTISRLGRLDPVLKSINLDIHYGITAIIGPVGSGKTTLLEAILGRHTCEPNNVVPLPRAAYAPQTPWIMNQSIRQNIIGALEFDQKWYDYVVSSCGLEADLKNIHGGDGRLAGSKGASLSGGQKQRVVRLL